MTPTPTLPRRRAALAQTLALGVALFSGLAGAQSEPYPAQPIRLVVGFPAGGPTDVAARQIAEGLAKALGKPVVVDNKPGANATIATETVANAKPDGLTLLMAATNHSINASLYKKLRYDSDRGFAAVGAVAVAPTVLVVRPTFPAKTLQALVSYALANPNKTSYASAGNGGTPHLSGELFKQATKTDILHVPYKGAAPAVVDLIGGQVDMMFATLGSVLPQIRAGQIRALAVAAPARSPLLPDVPTFAESGQGNFRLDSWYGILAPAGTPPAIVERLSKEIHAIVTTEAYRSRLATAGLDPVTDSTPASFGLQIRQEIATFGAVIRAAGVSID